MKLIAWFYTIFWMIYFPTCIAFNTLPGLSSVDEAMTFALIGFTALCYKNNSINKGPVKEYFVFLAILLFYIIYSLFWGENVIGGVFLEFLQQIRPYSIIFCTWILNPRFTKWQKHCMVFSVIVTFLLRITFPNVGETLGQVDLSTGQMAICAGMTWMIFHKDVRMHKVIALGLVLLGLILATKSKFYGEIICFIAVTFYIKKKIDIFSSRAIWLACILGIIVLFFVWEKFDIYYVSGMETEGIARAETTKVAFGKILWDYIPFGPGMGTFATNGAWKYYSPLYQKYDLDYIWGLNEGGGFICDIFYPSLCQYGLVGVFLFVWFWKRRLTNFNNIVEIKYFKIALIAFICLAIEQTADSSWLSGKGMGYCMLIGLCLNANKNIGLTDDGKPIEEEDETEKKEKIVYPKLLTATP